MSVVRYVLDNSQRYDVDPEKICLAGSSGGGWIVTGAANLMAKDGDILNIGALFIHSGMLSNEMVNYKNESQYEKKKSNNNNWASSSQDLATQSSYKL